MSRERYSLRAVAPDAYAARVVGPQWAPRSHELRDLLTRNTLACGVYPAESEEGR